MRNVLFFLFPAAVVLAAGLADLEDCDFQLSYLDINLICHKGSRQFKKKNKNDGQWTHFIYGDN